VNIDNKSNSAGHKGGVTFMNDSGDVTLSSKTISEWLSSASFVFSGHITGIGENNLDGVQLDDRMALVNVDDVVMSPSILGELSGKSVTVSLQSIEGVEAGQIMTFFASPFYYGKNVGLLEIGRTTLSAAEIRQVTINIRMAQLDEELKERINGARLIVSGRVLTTRLYPTQSFPGADDDIEWWTAQIRIETIEKGQPPSDDLWIYFPTGGDPRWGLYPKFYAGQEGVWLLRPITEIEQNHSNNNKRLQSNDNEKFLVAERSADFHAISDLARIQLLLLQVVKKS
jgi:hypothetical protein